MKWYSIFRSVSFKIGLVFSVVFIALLMIFGFTMYGMFTNIVVDYSKQELVARGNNHASILENNFDKATIDHVILMEKTVPTEVLITDSAGKIIGSSTVPDKEMLEHLDPASDLKEGKIVVSDWRKHKYLISVSPIGNGEGYLYMYYPSSILRDIVFTMNVLIISASIGIFLLAFGLIGFLSRRLTKPLLQMEEATMKMSQGKYRQNILYKGDDEIARLGSSIQTLGEQLQYYEDSRNQFLSAVSHEIRTPLTYIKGYSDVLKKGLVEDPEEKLQYLDIINREAQRITFMINDLFEMSKLQVGQFELNKERADINTIIERVFESLKPAAQKKGLEISIELEKNLPNLFMDVHRMEQVFYNLIENGIKYSNEGSVAITSFLRKEFIVIEVRDTGLGIPEQDLPRIWERFYRVDQSRTRKTGGTGLGLYVVKQIIEAHDGDIQVESMEKKGSIFTIYLKPIGDSHGKNIGS